VSSCNYHIRALRHIRSSVTYDATVDIACSLVNTRLDCNSLLYSTSLQNVARLQRVQNNLARVIHKLRRRDSISQHIRELHWLPVKERIVYKLAVITYRAVHTGQPSYLSNCLVKQSRDRVLRSNSQLMLQIPFCSI